MQTGHLRSVKVINKIDRGAIDEISDAIFNRARAKSSMNEYSDVMSQASSEIKKTTNNAFGMLTFPSSVKNEGKSETASKKSTIKNTLFQRTQNEQALQTSAMHLSVMTQAGKQIRENNNLMQKLNFLSSQATMNLYAKNR